MFSISTLNILFILDTIALSVILAVVIYNYFTAPRISQGSGKFKSGPFVSVLIPARNEEKNITRCVDSVIRQSYNNIEVIVLNDQSDDRTLQVLERGYRGNEGITIINGKPLPPGWTGKNWACKQLSEAAQGNVFLFVDADVELSRSALAKSISIFDSVKTDMLSCFPTQKISSLGEGLVVPMMNFLLLAFLPLKKVYTSSNKSFIAANGQFLMIRKYAYSAAGGHDAVKNKVVEDMEIARNVKRSGLKVITVLGSGEISCRMYEGLRSAVKGFSKNFYPGFNISTAAFIIMLLTITFLFVLPLALSFINTLFLLPLTAVILIRIFISLSDEGNALRDVLLHPLQMIMFFITGINSLITTKFGTTEWKGRSV